MNKKPVVPAWLPASWQLLYKYAEVKSVGNLTYDFLALHGFEFLLCNFELVWSQPQRLGLCVWRLLWWSASPRDLAGMIGWDINSGKFLDDSCQDCSVRFRKRNSHGVQMGCDISLITWCWGRKSVVALFLVTKLGVWFCILWVLHVSLLDCRH